MGKTRPTVRELIDEWNTKWDYYARALRTAEDEAALTDVRGFVREYAMAANAHNPPRIEDEIVWHNIAVGATTRNQRSARQNHRTRRTRIGDLI